MTQQESQIIIERAKDFFRREILTPHVSTALRKASHLKYYNRNPFLLNYLSNFLEGNTEPRSLAKALIYPRILGTSITTSFGMRIQKMLGQLFDGIVGSTTPGIDIEFTDILDGRRKYCQLKAGPQTINSGDVDPIKDHFRGIRNIARTNNLRVDINDFALGILYGQQSDLSSNYKSIDLEFSVFIGKDFWHRLTGQEDFYERLIAATSEVANEADGRQLLENAINTLTEEIEEYLNN